MFTSQQYRAKAAEYAELVKTAIGPNEVLEYQNLEQRFTMFADDMRWLTAQAEKARLTFMAAAIEQFAEKRGEPPRAGTFLANSNAKQLPR